LEKKGLREHTLKHDKNSGKNYISITDSKQVSVTSSAAGVTPMLSSKRYSSEAQSKVDFSFLRAMHIYNKYMGGVDMHDMHCNNLLPCIRSKKWTWMIFIRLIQAVITNSVVLFNAANESKNKQGTKDFALSISRHYLDKARMLRGKLHKAERVNRQSKCSICGIKTYKFCEDCALYF